MTTCESVQAVYVHVPFCFARCGYCDFYSEIFDSDRAAAFVTQVLGELDDWRRRARLTPRTVFVGGGTPTTLSPPLLARLLSALRDLGGPQGIAEFTIEANPATVSAEIASTLVEHGVNRVSLGAQSFRQAELDLLERQHDPEQVAQTIRTCRAAGIESVSLDLIFGVPGQTRTTWSENLRRALELDPQHLSCYGLTYEPGTRLHGQRSAGQVRQCDEDLEADLYELTIDELARQGLPQYEISNFARPGYECRHNLVYWRNEPYLGLGPAAAGFVDGVRYKNVSNLEEYVALRRDGRSVQAEQERLDAERSLRESVMLGLRLIRGIDRAAFRSRFGVDPVDQFTAVVERHVADGLLEINPTHLRLSRAGLLLADTVMADFL